MDELEKLKGAWKAQDYSMHRVSTTDIYKMLHAKSTSYVKWIFYISIFELVFVIALNLLFDNEKYLKFYKDIGLEMFLKIGSILSYALIIVFIYLFYKNYQRINVNSNAKALMKSILKTRKTVKNYIYLNIGLILASSITLVYSIFSNTENTNAYKIENKIPISYPDEILLISIVVFIIVFIGVLLIIYRIIYGILLRRLKKNYKELEQLDK